MGVLIVRVAKETYPFKMTDDPRRPLCPNKKRYSVDEIEHAIHEDLLRFEIKYFDNDHCGDPMKDIANYLEYVVKNPQNFNFDKQKQRKHCIKSSFLRAYMSHWRIVS